MSMPVQKPGKSKQDYCTPPEFIAAVKAKFRIDAFDCDLAADDENALAPLYFTERDSAFDQPTWHWGEGWNWLNPPYANIEPWVNRAYVETQIDDTQTLMLVPASVGANWWRDYVHRKAKVYFLNGRITFVGCEDAYPKDCALIRFTSSVFIPECYEVWSWTKGDHAA